MGPHRSAASGCGPPHLARCFNTFPDAEVYDGKDKHDAESKLPTDASHVLQSLRPMDLKDVASEVEKKERPMRGSGDYLACDVFRKVADTNGCNGARSTWSLSLSVVV